MDELLPVTVRDLRLPLLELEIIGGRGRIGGREGQAPKGGSGLQILPACPVA